VKRIILACMNKRVSVVMLFVSVLIFGILALRGLPVALYPPLPAPRLTVLSSYPGYPPEEIRKYCTIPLENAFSSLRGIKTISSAALRGKTVITLQFHWNTDMDLAGVETRQVIDNTMGRLPADAEKPVILPVDPAGEALLSIGAIPAAGDCAAAKTLCETHIRNRLQRIDGVASISVIGGTKREIRLSVDHEKAVNYGISFSLLHQFIRESNVHYPAGKITYGEREYIVRTDGEITGLNTLRELQIPVPAGDGQFSPIPLSELAEIEIGNAEPNSSFYVNGRESVALLVYGRPGASPVSLSKDIREELDRINRNRNSGITLSVLSDNSEMIIKAVRRLITSAAAGGLIVFTVILLFLKNSRAGAVLLLTFPWAVCFCFLMLYTASRSINIMSLGGIVIGTGMLVDNGIVVVERIQGADDIGKKVIETAPSLFSSTATTIIVFLPLLFLPGDIGSLYTDLALSVVFSLTASLISSVFIIPPLYVAFRRFFPARQSRRKNLKQHVEKIYMKLYRYFYRNPRRLAPALLLPLCVGAAALFFVPFRVFSPLRVPEEQYIIRLPPGLTMDAAARLAGRISSRLYASDLFQLVTIRGGFEPEDIVRSSNIENMPENLHVFLRPRQPRAGPFIDEVVRAVSRVVPGTCSVSPDAPDTLDGEIPVTVTGTTPEEALKNTEELISTVVGPVVGRERIRTAAVLQREREYLYLYPVRERFSASGLTLAQAAGELSAGLSGTVPSRIRVGEEEYNISLTSAAGKQISTEKLRRYPIPGGGGTFFTAETLFRFAEQQRREVLFRENRKDIVTVTIETAGISRREKMLLAEKLTSTDYAAVTGGPARRENLRQIALSFAAALLLVYFVLGAHFESFFEPLLVFVPLPFAAAGVAAGLWISGSAMDVYASLGVLVLLGLSINNSIFLSAAYKEKLTAGAALHLSIRRGSISRIRPILLTTLTTITALIPLSIDPHNTSPQSGMAGAIIGGLAVSALITVILQPSLFSVYLAKKETESGKTAVA
jgi:hydrophobic/amphiphilic exporter-1 (mainly G- bacteria), HAE1 family